MKESPKKLLPNLPLQQGVLSHSHTFSWHNKSCTIDVQFVCMCAWRKGEQRGDQVPHATEAASLFTSLSEILPNCCCSALWLSDFIKSCKREEASEGLLPIKQTFYQAQQQILMLCFCKVLSWSVWTSQAERHSLPVCRTAFKSQIIFSLCKCFCYFWAGRWVQVRSVCFRNTLQSLIDFFF